MNILEELMNEKNGALVSQLAERFNIDNSQAVSALQGLLPAIVKNMQSNSLGSILSSLGGSDLGSLFDSPEKIQDDSVVSKGNDVLGQIFGSKETSRAVAADVSNKTEFSSDTLKQMLPVVAAMVMGMLNRKASDDDGFVDSVDSSQGGLGGMLSSYLDADNDGSIVDDLLGAAKRML